LLLRKIYRYELKRSVGCSTIFLQTIYTRWEAKYRGYSFSHKHFLFSYYKVSRHFQRTWRWVRHYVNKRFVGNKT